MNERTKLNDFFGCYCCYCRCSVHSLTQIYNGRFSCIGTVSLRVANAEIMTMRRLWRIKMVKNKNIDRKENQVNLFLIFIIHNNFVFVFVCIPSMKIRHILTLTFRQHSIGRGKYSFLFTSLRSYVD